jgi:hypothetical protein
MSSRLGSPVQGEMMRERFASFVITNGFLKSFSSRLRRLVGHDSRNDGGTTCLAHNERVLGLEV